MAALNAPVLSAERRALLLLVSAVKDYLDGNYARHIDKYKCEHGVTEWDACEGCIDKHFAAALEAALAFVPDVGDQR